MHAFVERTDQVIRHLAFRDFLRAHPDEAAEYSDLKREVARQNPTDIYGYMEGKDAFIKGALERALRWRRQGERM